MAGQGLTVEWSEYCGHSGESPTEAFENDGSRATRIFWIHDWDDRVQAIWEILGYAYLEGTSTATKLLRYLPERHPDFPWLPATKINRIQGLGVATAVDTSYGRINTYNEGALLYVDYGFTTYDIKVDDDIPIDSTTNKPQEYKRFTSHTAKQSGEFFTYKTGSGQKPLCWAEGADLGKGYQFPKSKIIVTVDHEFTWHFVPYLAVPLTVLKAMYGKINKTAITLDGETFPAHTLQLVGVDYKRIMMPYSDISNPELGDIAYDLVYTMKEKPSTFTKDFNPNTGLFQKVSFSSAGVGVGTPFTPGSMSDGVTPFDEAEFANLFIPAEQ